MKHNVTRLEYTISREIASMDPKKAPKRFERHH